MSKAPAALSAKHILAIQQLQARFAQAFDDVPHDAAKTWADTFTKDGTFALLDPSGAVQMQAQGTEELIAMHDRLADPAKRHWYTNLLIEPAPGGASMQFYLMTVRTRDLAIERTAIYRDTLVKVRGAWKLKSCTVTLDAGAGGTSKKTARRKRAAGRSKSGRR